ncbi:MAG: hypothetical protein ACQERC_02625 [Bacteroidota bacterium]
MAGKLDLKRLFSKHWIHLLAVGLFFLVTLIYFRPQFSGQFLKQHDIEQYKGMSNEVAHFRTVENEEPLWTNSMFGGMPTYQISTKYKGRWIKEVTDVLRLGMKSPAGLFFLYLIGFYIMLLCMRVDPKLAIFGAFAFAFSSYYIIILQAGHNSKAATIGLMGPVIGAFYMAYRYNLKWGILLSALFMSMQLSANHFQISYYLGIVLVGFGIAEFARGIQKQQWKRFLTATGGILVAYLFALGINYGNITLTNDYAKHTTRGGNDITINPDGTSATSSTNTGLDKDYITQWSYGISESMTLLSPYVKGGSNNAIKDSPFSDLLKDKDLRRKASLVAKNDVYWGAQPFVSGPVYLGIIVFFLALMGMIYLQGPLKWSLAGVAVLALLLSWGKNFMGLTDFFLDYIPGYNKFRAVTIILAIVELIIPLLAVLFLRKLFKERERIKANIRPFYIGAGGLLAVMVILTFTGLGDGYLSPRERDYIYNYEDQVRNQLMNEDPQRLKQNDIDVNNPQQVNQVVQQQMERVDKQFDALVDVRKSIYRSSMGRSILFLLVGIILVLIYLRIQVRKEWIIAGLGVFTIIDLVLVDLNYLNNEKSGRSGYVHWMDEADFNYPIQPTQADKQILQTELSDRPELKQKIDAIGSNSERGRRSRSNPNKVWSEKFQTLNLNSNYRVYNASSGFNSSRDAYFHKALNGYHGAKLRRIQNVKDFHIDEGNMDIFNMMNVKYFIQRDGVRENPGALGNGWMIQELNVQPHPNQEILALGNLYIVQDEGDKTLYVNGKEQSSDTISGRERIVLYGGDSIPVDIEDAVRSGVAAKYVEDVKGNRSWMPERELKKDTTNSFTPLLSIRKIHDFEPRREAIIAEEAAQELSSLTYSGQGSIEMKDYAPNKIVYDVQADGEQFGVFSEVYYPDGWKAYIDGEEVDIHRVNYLLRGVVLPSGDHELIFEFDEPRFDRSNTIAMTGSILLFGLMIFFFARDYLLPNKRVKEKD